MNNLTTLTGQLRVARNEADAEVVLDLTASGDYASKPSVLGATGVGIIDILSDKYEGETETIVNGIEFMLCAGNAAGKTLNWRILAWRTANGPARIMGAGTAETGTQAVVTYPHNGEAATLKFWVDNIVITYENWPKEVEATDTGNSNSVASLWCDDCGYRYWKVEIPAGGTATDIAAYWSFF